MAAKDGGDEDADTGPQKRQKVDNQPQSLIATPPSSPTINEEPCKVPASNAVAVEPSAATAVASSTTIRPTTAAMKPCLPFTKLLEQDLIKIRVGKGDEYQIHQVHKQLLCKRSAYFDAAINGGFQESVQNEIILEEDSPLIFEFFLTWLYTSRLPSLEDYLGVSIMRREEPDLLFVKLFAMADRFDAPDLQAICYGQLRHMLSDTLCPGTDFMKEIYEVTTPQSQLRKYFVAMGVFNLLGEEDGFRQDWIELVESVDEFSTDVSRAVVRLSTARKNGPISGLKHPFQMKQYQEFIQGARIAFLLQSRHGIDCNMSPSDGTGDHDPESLVEKIKKSLVTNQYSFNWSEMLASWPLSVPSDSAMREAGWYHYPEEGSDDTVRCIHCYTTRGGWSPEDRPFAVHRALSPNCPFVVAIESGLRPPLLPFFSIPPKSQVPV